MVDKEFFPCPGVFDIADIIIFIEQNSSDLKDNPLEPFSKFVMTEVIDGTSWAVWCGYSCSQMQDFLIVRHDDQRYYFPLAFLPYMEKFVNYTGGSLTSTEEVPPLAPDEEDVLLGYLLPVKTMDNMLNTLKQL